MMVTIDNRMYNIRNIITITSYDVRGKDYCYIDEEKTIKEEGFIVIKMIDGNNYTERFEHYETMMKVLKEFQEKA